MAVDEFDGVGTVPSQAQNVLVEAPVAAPHADHLCLDLTTREDHTTSRVLTISYRDRAHEVVERWHETVGDLPVELVVVEAREDGSDGSDLPDSVTVLSESPGDLTWLGVHTSEYLTRWHEADERIGVCIDSLTSMLQYAELEKVYRFLHIFSGRVETADARAHNHIDPRAHTRQELHTLKQLCDTVVTYEEGADDASGWSILSR